MQTRELGRSGLRVSAVGLGCMGISEFYGPGDETESMATIHRAIELGCTFLDTAPPRLGRAPGLCRLPRAPPLWNRVVWRRDPGEAAAAAVRAA